MDNADEILQATTGWVNEDLHHPRRDKIVDFARGHVLMRIGANDYEADVLVAAERSGRLKLYDIMDMTLTSFTEKIETGTATTKNPSPGTASNTVHVSTVNNMPQNPGNVNPQNSQNTQGQHSLHGAGMTYEEGRIWEAQQDIIERLTEERLYWKRLANPEERNKFTLYQYDVDKLSRQLIKNWQSDLKTSDVSPMLKQVAESLLEVDPNAEDMSVEQVKEAVRPVAKLLVENARELVNADELRDYKNIRSMLRRICISLRRIKPILPITGSLSSRIGDG